MPIEKIQTIISVVVYHKILLRFIARIQFRKIRLDYNLSHSMYESFVRTFLQL